MSDANKIYDKFDADVQFMVIYAKAASRNAMVDCIYPESFIVGMLTMGPNSVINLLSKYKIDLEKCLKEFKTKLASKKEKRASKIDIDSMKVSKQVHDICKMANEEVQGENSYITIVHMFKSILELSEDVRNTFISLGLDIDKVKAINIRSKIKTEPKPSKKTKKGKSVLDNFCIDMTTMAEKNMYDPIIARDNEIEEAITILCRRNKSNPVLVGEPGVGKSAIVEGICQRIVSQTVPKKLKEARIYSLNLGSLVAGTKYRGEFENRLQKLLDELGENQNYILFIDEIHTMIGAGSASGSIDASNMMKPQLARGLKCIGATTNSEYKKIFSGDGALDRRFEKIDVEEPSTENTRNILFGIKSRLEEFHKCVITDDAIDASVKLTKRYRPSKYFPDKAIDCIDTACAKYSWANNGVPQITANDIAMVVSKQCQIPMEIILWDNYERINNIEKSLKKSIVGQDHAIDAICRVLKSSYSGIRNPDKPIGIFVLGGPSGVGKTYTAKELAGAIFNSDSSFIRLDMSEYSEAPSLNRIIGSPPGYVGFHDASIVADKIKRKPYCVLLLDEVEKAHPDVMKLFLQVMSDGVFTDANGEKINCKNIILIMTGNFGMNEAIQTSLGFCNTQPNTKNMEKDRLISYCRDRFGLEFVNRIDDFIPYYGFTDENLEAISIINITKFTKRIMSKNFCINFDSSVFKKIVELSKNEHGANAMMIDRIISKHIEPCIADILLQLDSSNHYSINVSVEGDGFVCSKSEIKKKKGKKHEQGLL